MTPMIYISRRGLAALIPDIGHANGEVAMLNRERQGLLPPPDVKVGTREGWTREGWTPERAALYAGYAQTPDALDPDAARPDWWHADTRAYMSVTEVAARLGMTKIGIIKSVERGRMVDAAVVITLAGDPTLKGRSYGWDPDAVTAYGRQVGWLDADSAVCDIRRGGARRKVFEDTRAVA